MRKLFVFIYNSVEDPSYKENYKKITLPMMLGELRGLVQTHDVYVRVTDQAKLKDGLYDVVINTMRDEAVANGRTFQLYGLNDRADIGTGDSYVVIDEATQEARRLGMPIEHIEIDVSKFYQNALEKKP